MLEISGLKAGYDQAGVLRGVDMNIAAGQITALLGRNGMGKSSLVRSIMGLRPPQPQAGSIIYQGTEILGQPPHKIARMGIALVPQGRRLFDSLSVLEHLKVFARSPANNPWDLDRIFTLFPGLKQRKQHLASQLSGGERQMLAIARALVLNPCLLLLDEPSEGLAPVVIKQVEELIVELSSMGLSILLLEQNLPSALRLAHNVYIMESGRIVHQDSPQALLNNQQILKRYLGV